MMGQTQFGYMTFPQSHAFEVLESQFMTLPLKELAITSDMANTMPHIICNPMTSGAGSGW